MPFTKSLQGPSLALLVALLISATSNARADGPYPAHKVVDNIYYVGSNDLAIYLVTTPKGHMLINTGFDETVPLIQASVRSLGFKMTDIKIILASHAHADHVAGHARAREVSGAKVFVMTGDEKVIAGGGKGQYLYTDSRWRPCPVRCPLGQEGAGSLSPPPSPFLWHRPWQADRGARRGACSCSSGRCRSEPRSAPPGVSR